MSRAINRKSLTAPDFLFNISYEERDKFQNYLGEYTKLNNDEADAKPMSYCPSMASVKFNLRTIYQGVNSLSGEVQGNAFLDCNSIVDSVKTVNQISAELTLFDLLNKSQTIEPKLREFNEYTKKLFENMGDTLSINNAQFYDLTTNTYAPNPAYDAFIEWCAEFKDLLTDVGLKDYKSDVRNFWRVDSVLTATQSWEDYKYNLISFFRNSLVQTDYYGRSANVVPLHPMLKKNPLQAISNYLKTGTISYYDDRITTVVGALKDVAMANAIIIKNPQVMTMGITELSSYNHQSYYFSAGIGDMTKKNTEFVSCANIPDFTLPYLRRLSNDFKLYTEEFIIDSTSKLDEQILERDMMNLQMFNTGIGAMKIHWEEIVKHLYKQNAIDEIGLLYSNLLFPQTGNGNSELLSELMEKLKPIQTNYGWSDDLGNGYAVNFYIYQNQLQMTIRGQGLSDFDGDFQGEVRAKILSLGVPQYLQQPLRQILYDVRDVIDSNSDFELRQVASKIYHIENSRNAGRAKIQDKLQELHDFDFV